jgi:hypothetical protein
METGSFGKLYCRIDTKSGVSVTVNSNPAWGNGGAETVDGSDIETR